MPGTLYLVPSALGDTEPTSTTPAAVAACVHRLDYFIVENAKSARAELKRIGHPGPMARLRIETLPQPCGAADAQRLVAPVLAGADCGLMSEAGCPAVADPGSTVVAAAHQFGIRVAPLVGPSALMLALMACGLEGQRFAFHGYLPQRDPERARRIAALEADSRRQRCTQLFIETPYRNDALFAALLAACAPATRLCLASALTTHDETITTHSVGDWRKLPAPVLNRRPTVFLLLA